MRPDLIILAVVIGFYIVLFIIWTVRDNARNKKERKEWADQSLA